MLYYIKRSDMMETIKITKNIKMIAHRGLSGILQENTIPAFKLAGEKSYFGIETDVHVTKDNKYIICHDDSILRVCGIDLVIEETDYDVLRKQPVFNKDGSINYDMYLPSLEEYITICKESNKVSVLELKNKMKEENIIEIVQIVKELNHFDNTIFISFSNENIINLKKYFADIKCQFLIDINTQEKRVFALEFAIKYGVDLDVFFGSVDREFISLCHKNNVKLNVWTVDDLMVANNLVEMGVDYITSNILE